MSPFGSDAGESGGCDLGFDVFFLTDEEREGILASKKPRSGRSAKNQPDRGGFVFTPGEHPPARQLKRIDASVNKVDFLPL